MNDEATEKTHTLDDLGKCEFAPNPLAVLGHPVEHSISPAMHNAALDRLRERDTRFRGWAYYRFDVPPDELERALSLFHKHSFMGLNLTVPHKVEAMEWVKGMAPVAKQMGAVNTLVWDEFGYDGFNTDGYGIKRALEVDLAVSLKGADVILIGAGGAARAAAVQCMLDGCSRLRVGNRTVGRMEGLLQVLQEMPEGERVEGFSLDHPPDDLKAEGVLINATSLGLQPGDPKPFDARLLPGGWKVFDMIYNPPMTPLLQEAASRGLAVANGLSMLVHQGARSLEIWSRETVDERAMMTAACHALHLPPRYD
ncbi:MAG: shikimate dehydrogenase [Opitutales bacterium]